jgi:hypothetical protein
MCDPLQFEESIIGFHAFDIDLVRTILRSIEIEIMSSLIVMDLIRISTSIVHRMRDVDSFFFRELKVDLTELWSLVPDTRTIGVRDEVCMIDLVILVSVLLIIILWKRWDISESDELRSLQFSDNRKLSLSLEYGFESTFCNDILLSIILHERIVDIIAHGECHIGRDRPWGGSPGENRYRRSFFLNRSSSQEHIYHELIDFIDVIIDCDEFVFGEPFPFTEFFWFIIFYAI